LFLLFFRKAALLQPDNTDALLKLGNLHLSIGESSIALKHIKDCLKLDQDHKECRKQFKQLKTLEKSISAVEQSMSTSKWQHAIEQLTGETGLINAATEIGAKELMKRMYGFACEAYSKVRILLLWLSLFVFGFISVRDLTFIPMYTHPCRRIFFFLFYHLVKR